MKTILEIKEVENLDSVKGGDIERADGKQAEKSLASVNVKYPSPSGPGQGVDGLGPDAPVGHLQVEGVQGGEEVVAVKVVEVGLSSASADSRQQGRPRTAFHGTQA